MDECGLLWQQKHMTSDPAAQTFNPANNVQSHPPDDYGTLLMAEALLEECLQDNMDLLRTSTPLMEKTHPRLSRAKSHLNTILSRGLLTVSWNRVPFSFSKL